MGLFDKIKDVVQDVAPVVLPFAINAVAPGLGTIASTALGAGIGTLIQGGDIEDALKAGAVRGAAGALFKGIGSMAGGGQLMEGISASALQGYNDKQAKTSTPSSSSSAYKTPVDKYLTSTESPTGKAGNFAVYMPKDPNGKIKYVPIGGTNNTNNPPTPDSPTETVAIDIEIMDEAEKYVKNTYPKLKEGGQEFANKVMERYNYLLK